MFERYTEKARRVIFFVRYEASHLCSRAIEAEHILLGLLREDKQLAKKYFRDSRSTVDAIRQEIEGRNPQGDKISESVDMPLSTSAKLVLSHAADESDRLGHRHIGTEHLLLGILRAEKSPAAQILYERGLSLSQVREDVKTVHHSAEKQLSYLDTDDLQAQFSRLLDLLVRKGVIDENERLRIIG